MNHRPILAACLILSAPVLGGQSVAGSVERSGIRGGIVVHLGCGDGRKTADMLLNGSYLVHGLDTSADHVAKASGRGVVGKAMWRRHIPITGKAIAMAGGVLFVAGEPMRFDDPSYRNYVAAYNGQLGGRLLAVSATDGKQLAAYRLNAAPAWGSIAVANKHLYIGLEDGTVQSLGQYSGR